jgi:hypothetical protein
VAAAVCCCFSLLARAVQMGGWGRRGGHLFAFAGLLAAFVSTCTSAVIVGISDRWFGGRRQLGEQVRGKIQAEDPPSEVVRRAVLQRGGQYFVWVPPSDEMGQSAGARRYC